MTVNMDFNRGREWIPFPREDAEHTKTTSAVAPVDKVRTVLTIICCLLICLGAAILIWLWATINYNGYLAEMQVDEMRTELTQLDEEQKAEELAYAQAYNMAFAGKEYDGELIPYELQLTWPFGDIMGWLEIPSIDVVQPIRHTDDDDVLMLGLGHLQESSLPVGGIPSHCLITGHSGMPRNRMFDDLDKLEVGDVFVIWTLGEPLAYRVYDIEVVEPEDTSSFKIVEGKDLCTLITCTPYGINTHRLLVHGERTDYVPEDMAYGEHHPTSDRLLLLVAGCIALGLIPWIIIIPVFGRRRWHLNRIMLADGTVIDEAMVAETNYRERCGYMVLDMKPWRRAKLSLFGVDVKGKWKRGDEKGEVVLKFSDDDDDEEKARRERVAIEAMRCIGANVTLPIGEFCAYGADKELGMLINDGNLVLVFGRKPAKKDGKPDGETTAAGIDESMASDGVMPE